MVLLIIYFVFGCNCFGLRLWQTSFPEWQSVVVALFLGMWGSGWMCPWTNFGSCIMWWVSWTLVYILARVLSQMYPATWGIKVTFGHRHKQQWNHGILWGKKIGNQSCNRYGFERYPPSRGTVAPSQCDVWADTVWIHFVQHIYRSLCIHRTLVTYSMEFSFHEKAWQQCSVGSSFQTFVVVFFHLVTPFFFHEPGSSCIWGREWP